MKFTDRMQLRKLEQQWQVASDERRKDLEKQMDAIRQRANKAAEQEKEEKTGDKGANKSSGSKNSKTPAPGKKPTIPPLSELQHGPYCSYVELMPMVRPQDKKGWMTYEMFREKEPNANIFDILPTNIAVMYLNQDRYQELESVDPHEVMQHCARRLPTEYEAIELAIINGLLYAEAQFDPRIKKLGYKGESMYDFEDNHLFVDYFNGVIFNAIHADMTLEEARKFALSEEGADTGEQSTGTGTAQKAGGNNGGKSGKDDKSGAPKENQGTTKTDDKKPAPKPQPPKKPTSKPGGGNSHAWATL